MSILVLIIKREFIAKVRNKSFVLMTFLSPVLVIGMVALIAYLADINHGNIKKIAVHDTSGLFRGEFVNTAEVAYCDVSNLPLVVVKDSIAKSYYDGVLYIPETADIKVLENKIQYISNESPSLSFITNLEQILENKMTRDNAIRAGVNYELVDQSKAHIEINLTKISGEESVKGLNEIKVAVGALLGYLIMMFIIIYGNMVMRSVIEEKTNRIIEIIISSVKSFQLMMGKIVGTSLAGLLQFVIWVIMGLILLIILSTIFGMKPGQLAVLQPELINTVQEQFAAKVQMYIAELWKLPIMTIILIFIIYFLGGYFLYSSFYAAIGAAVDSETDTQQFLLPVIAPLMLSVYVGFFTVISNPHGTVAILFSMFPLTSPIVMMMRVPFGVPWWQLILSVLLLFAAFFLIVWFAAKIYRIGILMYGKKPTYKEVFKWLKY